MNTPDKVLNTFLTSISKDVTVLKYSSLVYFGTAIPLVLSTLYFSNKEAENICSMVMFVVFMLGSVFIAIILTLSRIYWRQKKIKEIKPNFWNWDRDGFRDWQKLELRKIFNIKDHENQVIDKAYSLYIVYVKSKIEKISPLVKPAVIMSFIMPPYVFTVKVILEHANTLQVYMLYLLLIVFNLVLILISYHFVKNVFDVLFSEKRVYGELLSLLEELEFERMTKTNKSTGVSDT